ncbi:hypothetical protein Trydic_g1369 [Trypoxylus dichotomus]
MDNHLREDHLPFMRSQSSDSAFTGPQSRHLLMTHSATLPRSSSTNSGGIANFNLQRRSAVEGARQFRLNFSNVIREIQPLVEYDISNFLTRPTHSEPNILHSNRSVVINIEEPHANNASAENVLYNHNHGDSTVNNNNNNSANPPNAEPSNDNNTSNNNNGNSDNSAADRLQIVLEAQNCLTILQNKPLTVWDLLWTVGITDFILKLITVMLKILLTLLPDKIIAFQKRGKIYLFMEALSQLYRSLAPIQPWLYYILESYQGPEKIVGVFLAAAYMLLQNVTVGSSPSKEQIQTAGEHCPICHDEYDSPVLLQCRHIFCESCVTTWFDREQTCPLCRAKIVDDPSWRDGSTTFFVQLF